MYGLIAEFYCALNHDLYFAFFRLLDNLANVTALKHMHELSAETYSLYVCGIERRNIICATLTIELQGKLTPRL